MNSFQMRFPFLRFPVDSRLRSVSFLGISSEKEFGPGFALFHFEQKCQCAFGWAFVGGAQHRSRTGGIAGQNEFASGKLSGEFSGAGSSVVEPPRRVFC